MRCAFPTHTRGAAFQWAPSHRSSAPGSTVTSALQLQPRPRGIEGQFLRRGRRGSMFGQTRGSRARQSSTAARPAASASNQGTGRASSRLGRLFCHASRRGRGNIGAVQGGGENEGAMARGAAQSGNHRCGPRGGVHAGVHRCRASTPAVAAVAVGRAASWAGRGGSEIAGGWARGVFKMRGAAEAGRGRREGAAHAEQARAVPICGDVGAIGHAGRAAATKHQRGSSPAGATGARDRSGWHGGGGEGAAAAAAARPRRRSCARAAQRRGPLESWPSARPPTSRG